MKRVVLTISLMLLFLAGMTTGEPVNSQTPGERPNIVFIVLDDASSELLEEMPIIQSRMADTGVTLPNSIYSVAWCGPSRASILRGQYPHNHGVAYCSEGQKERPTGTSWDMFRSKEDSTYATWLRDSGYDTGYIGKYINGYNNTTEVPPGWNRWYGWLGEYGSGPEYRINENGAIQTYERAKLHDTSYMSWRAKQFIQAREGKSAPWLLTVAPNAPHTPNWSPRRHREAFKGAALPDKPSFNEEDISDKGAYMRERPLLSEEQVEQMEFRHRQRLRAMLSVDELVDNVVDTLRATRQGSSTYVFLWNDNGFHLGTHRLAPGKLFPYEEDVRYPMIVRGPGVPAGETAPQMTVNTDIAPTFADIANVEPPDFVDGRSILPLLSGNPPEEWRSAALLEFESTNHPLAPPAYHTVRTDDEKYIELEGGDREFYDLTKDPFELEGSPDTADPARVADLERRLRELEDCAGASCREAEGGAPDGAGPPSVRSTTPFSGAGSVSATANVTATFSEAMNEDTIDGATFKLARRGAADSVAATVSYNAASERATLNPSRDLVSGAAYTATVTTGAEDLAGNALDQDKVWSFRAADTTKPTVASVSPRAGAGGFPRVANVTATFSEAMRSATVNRSTFTLRKTGAARRVAATVSYSPQSKRATLNPSANLQPGATYIAVATTGTKDLAGNPLARKKVWRFTARR